MASIDEIKNYFDPKHDETTKEIKKVGEVVEKIQEKLTQSDERIEELHSIIETQEKKIEQLERKILQKNLIISGIEERENENLYEVVLNLFKNTFKFNDISELEIDDARRMGKRNGLNIRPILIELTRKRRKYQILQNAKILKGTKIGISEHLPQRVVQEQKLLRPIMFQARSEGHYASIKYDKININGNLYTSKDLAQEKEEYEDLDTQVLPRHVSIANITEDIMKSRDCIQQIPLGPGGTQQDKVEKRKANSPLENYKKKNDSNFVDSTKRNNINKHRTQPNPHKHQNQNNMSKNSTRMNGNENT